MSAFSDAWPEDSLLQSIASENNLSETAFLVKTGDVYELRWFTPRVEVDLCGHATLASAFAIFQTEKPGARRVDFQTKSGILSVERQEDLLVMDFPARPPGPCEPPHDITGILGLPPSQVMRARDLLAVYEEEEQVRKLTPDFARIAALDYLALSSPPRERRVILSRGFSRLASVFPKILLPVPRTVRSYLTGRTV